MVDFSTHILNNPRGREYSYAFRVRGFPYLWTDGKANWSADADEIIHGGLGKTDWSFDFKSNPLDPLDVGSGLNVVLVDEPSRRTRYLFSPDKTPTYRSHLVMVDQDGLSPSATTVSVLSTSGLTAGDYLYCGLETFEVSSITNATDFVAVRGRFGTLKYRHQVRYDGNASSVRGAEVSSLPTVWAGRFVEIYIAPIEPDGTAGTQYPIWAGRLGSFTLTGKSIRLSCDSLTAPITKDAWPDPLKGGSTGTDTFRIYLTQEQMFIVVDYSNGGAVQNNGNLQRLGTYDNAGTFTYLTTEGYYTLQQIAQVLTDTVGFILGAVDADIRNGFAVNVHEHEGKLLVSARNDTDVTITFNPSGLIERLLSAATTNLIHYYTVSAPRTIRYILPAFKPNGFPIDKFASQVVIFPDDKRDIPTINGCFDEDYGDMVGFIAVSDDEDAELMSFTAANNGSMGETYLSIRERALGGTEQRAWGYATDDKAAGNVRVQQVMAITQGSSVSMSAGQFLLYLLLSVDGQTGLNGGYDKLGARFGMAYHQDFVDYEGILAKMNISDMPKPYLWWVSESGKGKAALEQFMKLHGLYFVTRRFERNGSYYFGLSVDVVDVPTNTRYNRTITDAYRLADSDVEVDINERLIINTIAVSPRFKFGVKDEDEGGKRYAYAEDSINRFGASKTLEFKASVLFSGFSSQFVGPINDTDAATTALATAVSLRWFGAYASGNFTLELETPHIGWAVQNGDRVILDLTGCPNPTGEDGMTATAAKVIECKHIHGKKTAAKITFRISFARVAELAPNFTVTAANGTSLTLSANAYSVANAGVPFEGDTSPAKDLHWFNATRHTDGAGLRVYIYEQGNHANGVERTITSTVYASDRVVINSSLPGGLTSLLGVKAVIGTFIDYDDPTALMAKYAYIGSNDVSSKLGTLDASTADVEAFEWV